MDFKEEAMDQNALTQLMKEISDAETAGDYAKKQELLLRLATQTQAEAEALNDSVDAQRRVEEVLQLNAELESAKLAEAQRREAEAAALAARTAADAAKAALAEMLASLQPAATPDVPIPTPIPAPVFERHVPQTYNPQPPDRIVFDDDDRVEVETQEEILQRAWRLLDNFIVPWSLFKSALHDAGAQHVPHFTSAIAAAEWMRGRWDYLVDFPKLNVEAREEQLRLEREEETRIPTSERSLEDIFGDWDDEDEITPREIPAVEPVASSAPLIDFDPEPEPESEEQSWWQRMVGKVQNFLPEISAHLDDTHP